jgi:putative glutamine transport system substrate-binding protein
MCILKLKKIALLSLILLSTFAQSIAKEPFNDEKPEKKSITVNYLNRYPFSYTENTKDVKGIEIEILESFSQWVRKNKNIDLEFDFVGHTSFDALYETAKKEKINSISAGTITIKKDRLEDVRFSAPYLRNVSVLISNGEQETMSDLAMMDSLFANNTGLASKNSVHLKHLQGLKDNYYPALNIDIVESQTDIPAMVAKNKHLFGYIDLIQFWQFKKNNPESFIKIHRIANVNEEQFGFAFGKDNEFLSDLFDEFFNDGFGFTSTKQYHNILEKYLGKEIVPTVEINFADI